MFGFKRNIKKELNDIWTNINTLNDFRTKINNAVPTFNKMDKDIKEIDAAWTTIYKLCIKMDEKIRNLEKKPINTTKSKKKGK